MRIWYSWDYWNDLLQISFKEDLRLTKGWNKQMKSQISDGAYHKSKIWDHIAFRHMTKLSEQAADIIAGCAFSQPTNKYLRWHLSLTAALSEYKTTIIIIAIYTCKEPLSAEWVLVTEHCDPCWLFGRVIVICIHFVSKLMKLFTERQPNQNCGDIISSCNLRSYVSEKFFEWYHKMTLHCKRSLQWPLFLCISVLVFLCYLVKVCFSCICYH